MHDEGVPPPMQQQRILLTDFPDALLVQSAEYLSNTSCVSFAMALTSHNMMSQQPSTISTAIANASKQNWDNTDLKEVQDICGHILNDIDVKWILFAIDGVHKIKSLKITNCIGITGVGLEPLRESIILESIDLSLVGDHERPTINPEPQIFVSAVVPTLESIINTEGNSFVHVQLPKTWRDEKSNILTQFLQRFDRELNRRRIKCMYGCEATCESNEHSSLLHWRPEDEYYGIIRMTCYQCKKIFC